MEIKRESQGDVAILRLAGRIDTSNAPLLEEELDRVIKSGSRKVLLVMHDVSYISSGGLRVLLITAKKLKGPDDRFGLSRVSPEVYKILKLSGFTTIFSISGTEEEGIAGW
jgi:anti-sigma B factor antagonist